MLLLELPAVSPGSCAEGALEHRIPTDLAASVVPHLIYAVCDLVCLYEVCSEPSELEGGELQLGQSLRVW